MLVYYALAAIAVSRVWVLGKQKLEVLSQVPLETPESQADSDHEVNVAQVKILDRNKRKMLLVIY